MVSEVDPPVNPDRIGAAFGLPDVSVRSSTGLQGSGGTNTLWEYRTEADRGFRVGLVVAAFPSRDGDLADFVRGAAGFTGPVVVPLRPLTGIADHAAIYRTQQCVGVAAASRRGRSGFYTP